MKPPTILLVVLSSVPSSLFGLSSFPKIQRGPRPGLLTDETIAEDVLSSVPSSGLSIQRGPRPELPTDGTIVEDGAYGLAMIALFRIAMSTASGYKSDRPFYNTSPGESYRGLVDISRRLFSVTEEDTAERVKQVLRAFPTQPRLLGGNQVSCELLALLTPALMRFLVGPASCEEWDHPSGDAWKSKVVIKQCRFLEASGCKGMCVGLCQRPTEAFFNEELDLPMTMRPNFEDLSCELTWGRRPEDAKDDPVQDLQCFSGCSLMQGIQTEAGPVKVSDMHRRPAAVKSPPKDTSGEGECVLAA